MRSPLRALMPCLAAIGLASSAQAKPFDRRGVLEGFYGTPWTWRQRQDMIPWLAAHHFNLLVIAPKDEPSQRLAWRRPLSEEEERGLRSLSRSGSRHGVSIGWALSPGADLRYDDPAELKLAAAKFDSALSCGVNWPVLAFDDTQPREEQIDFANRILALLMERHPRLKMTFIPALYWGDQPDSSYLKAVAQKLDARFIVGWTGPGIISRSINAADARRFSGRLDGRPLALGDNYPVQDRLAESGRLFLGPLENRDPGLSESQSAYLANASPLAWLSRLPLATAGAFAWSPEKYDPEPAWRQAAEETLKHPILVALARECRSSYLTQPGQATGRTSRLVERCLDESRCEELEKHLRRFLGLEAALRVLPPPMIEELSPWLRKARSSAAAGLDAISLLRRSRAGRKISPAELDHWRASRREDGAQKAVISDLSLERLANAAAAALEGKSPPPSMPIAAMAHLCAEGVSRACENSIKALKEIEDAPRSLGIIRDKSSDAVSLFKGWLYLLADQARLAHQALDGRPSLAPNFARRPLRHWRLLPLLACKARLEEFIASKEKLWLAAHEHRVRPAPWPLRLWLKLAANWRPDSFLSRLERALSRNDPSALAVLVGELEELPRLLRGPEFPVELIPWLDKAADYGRLAGLGLDYELKIKAGGRLQEPQILKWRKRREDLRSSNGLELCVELFLTLRAIEDWARSSPRSTRFAVPWPANPAEAL